MNQTLHELGHTIHLLFEPYMDAWWFDWFIKAGHAFHLVLEILVTLSAFFLLLRAGFQDFWLKRRKQQNLKHVVMTLTTTRPGRHHLVVAIRNENRTSLHDLCDGDEGLARRVLKAARRQIRSDPDGRGILRLPKNDYLHIRGNVRDRVSARSGNGHLKIDHGIGRGVYAVPVLGRGRDHPEYEGPMTEIPELPYVYFLAYDKGKDRALRLSLHYLRVDALDAILKDLEHATLLEQTPEYRDRLALLQAAQEELASQAAGAHETDPKRPLIGVVDIAEPA